MKSLEFLFFTVYFTNCGLVFDGELVNEHLSFSIVSVSANPGNKQKIVDYTKCISDSHALFKAGIENTVKTSDPLSIDYLDATLPKLKYHLEDIKLTGLKNCIIEKFSVNRKDSSFDYNLKCPSIESKSHYILMGQLDDVYIDGKLDEIYVEGDGNLIITTGLYKLLFHGNYENNIGDDQVEHAHIKSHTLDFDVQEMVVFNFTNLYGGDKKKSDTLHKIIRENWRSIEKKLRVPVLNGFMDVFIENLNDFLKVIPIEEAIPKWCHNY